LSVEDLDGMDSPRQRGLSDFTNSDFTSTGMDDLSIFRNSDLVDGLVEEESEEGL
jgi:hypothetical protein